jgi:hypothetical protein
VVANPHYEESGHICSGSNIKLMTLAVPAAGPGYAERWVGEGMYECHCGTVIQHTWQEHTAPGLNRHVDNCAAVEDMYSLQNCMSWVKDQLQSVLM